MINSPFLYAFGKVLYSVTVVEGAMTQEESDLLRNEVARRLGPLWGPSAKAIAWRALFEFAPEEAAPHARVHSAESFVQEVGALDQDLRSGVAEACHHILLDMADAFGNNDPQTRFYLNHLYDDLQALI